MAVRLTARIASPEPAGAVLRAAASAQGSADAGPDDSEVKAPTAAQHTEILHAATAKVDKLEPRLAAIIEKILVDYGDIAARKFTRWVTNPQAIVAAADWTSPFPDQLIDVDALVEAILAKTDPVRNALIQEVMTPALEQAGLKWDIHNPLIAGQLASTGDKVTHIASTTRDNIMKIIGRAADSGLTIPQTSKLIQEGMKTAAATRATMIARTELGRAVNGASLTATQMVSKETKQPYQKVWLTAPGAKWPRHEDYDGLDGQTVNLNEYFTVGTAEMQFPGDPDGPPDETIMCRCALSYADVGVPGTIVLPDGTVIGTPTGEVPEAGMHMPAEVLREPYQPLTHNNSPNALAQSLAGRAKKVEPAITKAMQASANANGAKLVGLKFRLKGIGSASRKIADDAARQGISTRETAYAVSDMVRYTAEFSPEEYVAKTEQMLADMERRGFKVTRFRNTWKPDAPYAGVNVQLAAPNGYRFELQFHTPESFYLKEKINHPLYEEARLESTSMSRRAELDREMKANVATLTRPDGIDGFEYESGKLPSLVDARPGEWVPPPLPEKIDTQAYTKVSKDWAKGLDKNARTSVRNYTSEDYNAINAAVRGVDADMTDANWEAIYGMSRETALNQAAWIDRALEEANPLPVGTQLFRGFDPLAAIPDLNAEYRALPHDEFLDPAAQRQIIQPWLDKNAVPGEVISPGGGGFQSFSLDPAVAADVTMQERVGVVYRVVDAVTGSPVSSLSAVKKEQEVLVGRETAYRVRAVHEEQIWNDARGEYASRYVVDLSEERVPISQVDSRHGVPVEASTTAGPEGPGSVVRFTQTTDGEAFNAALRENARPGFLSIHSPEELAQNRLFLTPDGKAGYALTPQGDLQNVFRNPGGIEGAGRAAVHEAVQEKGARTLDAYDGFLPDLYEQEGFQRVGQMAWNDDFAPDGWDYKENGRPDVVFMATNPVPGVEVKTFTDWDEAKAYSREVSRPMPTPQADFGWESGGDTLYRGVSGSDAAAVSRSGELGTGDFGRGIYLSRSAQQGVNYARGDGVVMRAKLRADAKVATPADVPKTTTLKPADWARENGYDAYSTGINYVIVVKPEALEWDPIDHTPGEALDRMYPEPKPLVTAAPPIAEPTEATLNTIAEQSKRWDAELNGKEVDGVREYTSSSYVPINAALRGNLSDAEFADKFSMTREEAQNYARDIRAALDKAPPLPEGTQIYRGLDPFRQPGLKDAWLNLSKADKADQDKLGGMVTDWLDRQGIVPGAEIKPAAGGFQSFSLNPGKASRFGSKPGRPGVLFRVANPTHGASPDAISMVENEKEIIVSDHVTYRVASVQREVFTDPVGDFGIPVTYNPVVVNLEEVGVEPKALLTEAAPPEPMLTAKEAVTNESHALDSVASKDIDTALDSISNVIRIPEPATYENLDLNKGISTVTEEPITAKITGEIHVEGVAPGSHVQGTFDPRTNKIEIRRLTADRQSVFTHEFGHAVDHAIGARLGEVNATSNIEKAGLEGWAKAITESPTYLKQDAALKDGAERAAKAGLDYQGTDVVYVDGEPYYAGNLLYVLDPAEMFARSFTQYMSQTDEHIAAHVEEKLAQQHQDPGMWYWSKEEFEPIAAAMDDWFRTNGMLASEPERPLAEQIVRHDVVKAPAEEPRVAAQIEDSQVDALQAVGDDWFNALGSEQRSSVDSYTVHSYKWMNRMLSGKRVPVGERPAESVAERKIADVHDALAKAPPLPPGTSLYRAWDPFKSTLKKEWDALPGDQRFDTDAERKLVMDWVNEHMPVGSEIQTAGGGFQSFSADQTFAIHFHGGARVSIVYEVEDAKSGASLFSINKSEREVLVSNDQHYTVVRMSFKDMRQPGAGTFEPGPQPRLVITLKETPEAAEPSELLTHAVAEGAAETAQPQPPPQQPTNPSP